MSQHINISYIEGYIESYSTRDTASIISELIKFAAGPMGKCPKEIAGICPHNIEEQCKLLKNPHGVSDVVDCWLFFLTEGN